MVAGSIRVVLDVSSDAPDTAIVVKLMEEFEDGTAYNIRGGASTFSYRKDSLIPKSSFNPLLSALPQEAADKRFLCLSGLSLSLLYPALQMGLLYWYAHDIPENDWKKHRALYGILF